MRVRASAMELIKRMSLFPTDRTRDVYTDQKTFASSIERLAGFETVGEGCETVKMGDKYEEILGDWEAWGTYSDDRLLASTLNV